MPVVVHMDSSVSWVAYFPYGSPMIESQIFCCGGWGYFLSIGNILLILLSISII